MHIFDPSAVRRSVCVIQWGLRTFEIQLDLSGEPVLTTQSTIELTEQENACILMVQCVFINLMVSLFGKPTSRCS